MSRFGLYNTETKVLVKCRSYEQAFLMFLNIIKNEFNAGDFLHKTWAIAYTNPDMDNRIEQLEFFGTRKESKIINYYDVSEELR